MHELTNYKKFHCFLKVQNYLFHNFNYYNRVRIKLGFHIRGKRKRHALCVIRQKWKSMSTDEGDSICPDTACDLSCGCEWLHMRQTESLQVAIHGAKGTTSDGASWRIREYDVIVRCFLALRQEKRVQTHG